MTIQVTISTLAGTTGKQLAILNVTPGGIQPANRGYFLKDGQSAGPLSVYDQQALLLCEGFIDYGDDCRDGEMHRLFNPLDDFLRREHPAMSAEAELKMRLHSTEVECKELRSKLYQAQAQLSKIKASFAEAR